MKILRFKASKVHGCLNFDLRFNDDLTFLTGINGSGKTTVVRSIVSLISPSFINLAYIQHSRMSVTIEHEGKKIEISSKQEETRILFSVSKSKPPVEIPIFTGDPDTPPRRQYDEEVEYYDTLEKKLFSDPALAKVLALPTPMFLGLERRVQSEPFTRLTRDRPPTSPRMRRPLEPLMMRRNIFGATLLQSLGDAITLASTVYRDIQIQKNEITEDIRKSLILRAFEYSDVPPYDDEKPLPTTADRRKILERQKTVQETLENLGISANEIKAVVNPFFKNLRDSFKNLPIKTSISEALSPEHTALKTKVRQAIWNWIMNSAQFNRMNKVLDSVDKYAVDIRQIDSRLIAYLDSVNRFLQESSKTLYFDKFGTITVRHGDNRSAPVDTLSSGERQIVVILTHVAFHPAAAGANVLIIDEPELSLHVSWQEHFTKAVREANPNIQMIFATHSPAIIVEDLGKCLDLSL